MTIQIEVKNMDPTRSVRVTAVDALGGGDSLTAEKSEMDMGTLRPQSFATFYIHKRRTLKLEAI